MWTSYMVMWLLLHHHLDYTLLTSSQVIANDTSVFTVIAADVTVQVNIEFRILHRSVEVGRGT